MDPPAELKPEPVVLIIADISGYTRYMTANAKTLAHSQTIITELVKTIVQQVDLPLEVAKLEGDAVFLFGRKGLDPQAWARKKKGLGEKLFLFFDTFKEKVSELSYSTACTCNACEHIERLRLKVVVHSGEALFHRVFNFQELAGVDVIIVHRLLKNSVAADQYLLISEAAQADVELPNQASLTSGSETYDDLGTIRTGIYYPDGKPGHDGAQPARTTFAHQFRLAWSLFAKLWFKPLVSSMAADHPKFQHLTANSSKAGQFAFALLTLFLTPIYLPIGTVFVAFHARRITGQSQRHGHEHGPDCSCT